MGKWKIPIPNLMKRTVMEVEMAIIIIDHLVVVLIRVREIIHFPGISHNNTNNRHRQQVAENKE
jgi:hypothetical protein